MLDSDNQNPNYKDERIECWSCKREISIKRLAYNDGICPFCNCEIEFEDDDE